MHWLVPYSIRVRPPQGNLTLSRINKKGDKGHPVTVFHGPTDDFLSTKNIWFFPNFFAYYLP
jgi:hypothetical protein